MSEPPAWLARESAPPRRTLAAVLHERAGTNGESDALVTAGARLSWRALEEQSRLTARALMALGVGGRSRRDPAAQREDGSRLFYGAARIGAVTVPVNTRFKAAELEFCLARRTPGACSTWNIT